MNQKLNFCNACINNDGATFSEVMSIKNSPSKARMIILRCSTCLKARKKSVLSLVPNQPEPTNQDFIEQTIEEQKIESYIELVNEMTEFQSDLIDYIIKKSNPSKKVLERFSEQNQLIDMLLTEIGKFE